MFFAAKTIHMNKCSNECTKTTFTIFVVMGIGWSFIYYNNMYIYAYIQWWWNFLQVICIYHDTNCFINPHVSRKECNHDQKETAHKVLWWIFNWCLSFFFNFFYYQIPCGFLWCGGHKVRLTNCILNNEILMQINSNHTKSVYGLITERVLYNFKHITVLSYPRAQRWCKLFHIVFTDQTPVFQITLRWRQMTVMMSRITGKSCVCSAVNTNSQQRYIKDLCKCPVVMESTGDRWIIGTNRQEHRKRFHLITS